MECPICLDTLENGETHALDCTHTFHSRCLIPWLRQGNLTCPACRGTVPPSPPLAARTLLARASFLRTVVARRKRAPTGLKRLVDAVRTAEARECEVRRESRLFERAHREVLATSRKLRAKRYGAMRRTRQCVHHLGVYASPDVPLPALVVRPYL